MRDIRTFIVDANIPRAQALLEMLQSEYVGMYGEPDPNPEGDPRGKVVIITFEGKDVALGGWNVYEGSVAVLKRMYVHYAYRGQGLSKTLLQMIEMHARSQLMTHMILETGVQQTTAISLYTAAGYTPVEPFGYYAGQTTSVFLGKELS